MVVTNVLHDFSDLLSAHRAVLEAEHDLGTFGAHKGDLGKNNAPEHLPLVHKVPRLDEKLGGPNDVTVMLFHGDAQETNSALCPV